MGNGNAPLLVYIAAPYAASAAIPAIHTGLANINVQCVDTWYASPAPDLTQPPATLRTLAIARSAQIQTAHLIVTSASGAAGDYHQQDTILAYGYGIPVMWVGPLPGSLGGSGNGVATLNLFQPGVNLQPDVATAEAVLSTLVPLLQPTINQGTLLSIRRAIFERWS